MNKLLLILMCFSILYSVEKKKGKIPDFSGYSKKIEIKGLMEPNLEEFQKDKKIHPYQIEEIKKKALDFQIEPVTEDEIVIMETTRGILKLKLFPKLAPNHCNNFKKLANSGYYDGTRFHRVILGFMIQGGDILSRDSDRTNDGTGGPGWTVDAEFNETQHIRGILSMARSSDPNSAGSQFFICAADATHLDGKYTAFGEVIENIYVVDHIVNAMTDSRQVVMMSEEELPKGADPHKWIKLKNPKTKRFIYLEVPENEDPQSYKNEIKNKLRSDNPIAGAIINKVRVIHIDEMKNGNSKN
jgi:cyclophilin family peptidyl-prolyl cis-trans isomerase